MHNSETDISGQNPNLARYFRRFFFFQSALLKDWPRLRESRNGAGEMFWEVNRGGGLILPGAQGRALRAQNSYEALIWPYVPMKRAASARRRFLHRGCPPSLH